MRTSLRNTLFSMLSLFTLILLTGCQEGGGVNSIVDSLNPGAKKYDAAYLKQTLIPGKTTKAQVLQLFGPPNDEQLDQTSRTNGSNWSYRKSEEGIDKYLKLAHKYVSTDTSLKMYDTQAQVSKGQGMLDDVNSVAGTKRPSSGTTGSGLVIYFVNDVIDYYRLY